MINLNCQHCGKEGTLEEQPYLGKRLRLRCPYCTSDFIFAVPPGNGHERYDTSFVSATTQEKSPDATVFAGTIPPPLSTPAAAPSVSGPAHASVVVDEALVNEAKRIARLIISEIKLYNQDKIAKAKNKREVLEILRNDLIKGKAHYNTRIASKLPMGPDYFMETVKEILLTGKS